MMDTFTPEQIAEAHAAAEEMLGGSIEETSPDVIAVLLQQLADSNDYMVSRLTSSDPAAVTELQQMITLDLMDMDAVSH